MQRRVFIKDAAIAAAAVASARQLHASKTTPASPIARRALGKTGEQLSIMGFGGIVVMDDSPSGSANIVAEAVDRGINYFDVAPSYGNAQERLGPALAPYRNKSFLACKTEGRMKDDSRKQLEESLRLLKTDHLDLYQFHALTKMTDLDKVLGPGGAMETMEAAKKEGKIRYIGFSVHSAETALAAMDRYNFDTILFPVNFVLFTQANFGPQILNRARERTWAYLLSREWRRQHGRRGRRIILSRSAGISLRRTRTRQAWAFAGRSGTRLQQRSHLEMSATSASPWMSRRTSSPSKRTKRRHCSPGRMERSRFFTWATTSKAAFR